MRRECVERLEARQLLALVGVELHSDAVLTMPGLAGAYFDRSLRGADCPDWRIREGVAGTRQDTQLSFLTNGWGSREPLDLTHGDDENWEDFSVQWDGYLKVTQAGQRVGMASDDGSRMWVDLDQDGALESAELLDNGFAREHGVENGQRSPALAAGVYKVRIQYWEGGGDNVFALNSSPFVPTQFVASPGNPKIIVRAIVLNYDPHVPSEGSRTVHEVFEWANPRQLAAEFEKDLEWASGGAVDIQIVEWRDLEAFPALADGYRYNVDEYVANWRTQSGWHESPTDFYRLSQEQGLAELVNSGAIDEIWTFGPPGIDLFGEAWMVGPGSFFINGPSFVDVPYDRAIAGYGFNYERGVGEMLHNLGHRTENHGARAYNYEWNLANPTTTWDKFTANVLESPAGYAYGVGTCHVPANAEGHYDYSNPQAVQSTALDWKNYPILTGVQTAITKTSWEFGPFADSQRDYIGFFFGLMPRASGIGPDGRQANWYKYIFDFNSYEEVTGAYRQACAVLSAPALTAPGGAEYSFTVRYYDADGVDADSIDTAGLHVAGPQGYDQIAEVVRVVPSSDPRHITAVYSIPAPGGAWDRAEQGDYYIDLPEDAIFDLAANAFVGGSLGILRALFREPSAINVNAFVSAGQAAIAATASDIGHVSDLFDQNLETLYRTPQINPAQITLSFTAAQTIGGFRFYGAGSETPPAYDLNIEIADTAADLDNHIGSWRQLYSDEPAANRTVTLLELPLPVSARFLRATIHQLNGDNFLHLYDFTILGPESTDAQAPTATMTTTPPSTIGGTSQFINVTYADSSGINVASLDTGDLLVSGPGGVTLSPAFYDVDNHLAGTPRTAQYWFVPPGGHWDWTDNGTYTVSLAAGAATDAWGNAMEGQVLGTFTVALPEPSYRPDCDLAEMNADQWTAWAASATATVSNDTTRKILGASSIKFVTDGGFDTYLRFPPQYGADWDLSLATEFYFSAYAENPNGFQEASPWIRLRDVDGDYIDYRYYENGNAIDVLNEAIGKWVQFNVPLRAGEGQVNGWLGTMTGEFDFEHVASLEMHADTWDFGFTLWYDRVGFDLPVLAAFEFDWDGSAQALNVTFDQDVQGSLDVSDIELRNLATDEIIPASEIALLYDPATHRAVFTFPGYPNGSLPDGEYRASFSDVTDAAGNSLSGYAFCEFFVLGGDANHDGRVDIDDYFLIDVGYARESSGFASGDFNYDGAIDADDYYLIDTAFLNQSGPLAVQDAPAPLTPGACGFNLFEAIVKGKDQLGVNFGTKPVEVF